MLSSPGLEGASYLYVNPLHVRGGRYVRASTDTGVATELMRPAWHNCACCPPNVMRIWASLSHYIATVDDLGVQLHQYATAHLDLRVNGESVALEMETDYPWDGQVTLKVRESPSAPWALSLRVPDWCRHYTVAVNGDGPTPAINENGYLVLERSWRPADELVLTLHMKPEYIAPHPRIDAIRGCLAVQRGPLVYCFESHDQPAGVDLLDVKVVANEPLSVAQVEILGGVKAVHVAGQATTAKWGGSLYQPLEEVAEAGSRRVQLVAMPYFAWGNRGMQSMRVWVPKQE